MKNIDYIVGEHHIDITSHNYVSDDKFEGYYPFWDRYEQMRDEQKDREQ